MSRIWAIVLIAVGLVFVGQGFGVIRNNSFMVDDIRWAAIGAACAAIGAAILARGRAGA
jgi:hypothetical protein